MKLLHAQSRPTQVSADQDTCGKISFHMRTTSDANPNTHGAIVGLTRETSPAPILAHPVETARKLRSGNHSSPRCAFEAEEQTTIVDLHLRNTRADDLANQKKHLRVPASAVGIYQDH